MRDHREFAACGIAAMLAVAGSTFGSVVALDTFGGGAWNLPEPPLKFDATFTAANGYLGVAEQRMAIAAVDYHFVGQRPTEESAVQGTGISTTSLDVGSRTMSITSSGEGSALLSYSNSDQTNFSVSGWQGIWMRYAVTTGTARVSAWVGSDGGNSFSLAEATLAEGSVGYLYFAFGALPGATAVFAHDLAPDFASVVGIVLQFRSADGNAMAMSITGGIIPAPGAAALVGLAGLMVRRRRN
jgi:hypothetical protein